MLRLLVVAVEDLRGRLESNEGRSCDALDDALQLLATEGARVWEGPTGILGVFEREAGGMNVVGWGRIPTSRFRDSAEAALGYNAVPKITRLNEIEMGVDADTEVTLR